VRLILVPALLALASCASHSTTDLDERLSSWSGASVHELAAALGEPTSVADDAWEWRYTGPGMQPATTSFASAPTSGAQYVGSTTGTASSGGFEGKSWPRGLDTNVARKECTYRAKLEGARRCQVYFSDGPRRTELRRPVRDAWILQIRCQIRCQVYFSGASRCGRR